MINGAVVVLQAYAGTLLFFFANVAPQTHRNRKSLGLLKRSPRGWGLKGHEAISHVCVRNCKDMSPQLTAQYWWKTRLHKPRHCLLQQRQGCSDWAPHIFRWPLKEDSVNARCFLPNVRMDEGTERQRFDIPMKKWEHFSSFIILFKGPVCIIWLDLWFFILVKA